MRFHIEQYEHYSRTDRHTNKMYLYILNQEGEILLNRNVNTDPVLFLKTITPYRDDSLQNQNIIKTIKAKEIL